MSIFKKIYLYFFQRDRYNQSRIIDDSKCKQCGKCCILLGKFRCPFLTKENICRIYKHRPFTCRLLYHPVHFPKKRPKGCGYEDIVKKNEIAR